MIVLASRSPRRRALLAQLGVQFETLDVEIDETRRTGETPEALVTRLAADKAEAGRHSLKRDGAHRVIAADTVVVVGDQVLGKPRDATHASDTLMRLSDGCHEVLSAVALAGERGTDTRLSRSRVCFRKLSAEECRAYAATGEPLDKAGAYAIQGLAAAFVTDLQGSYSGVVGLPLYETAELLTEAGEGTFLDC